MIETSTDTVANASPTGGSIGSDLNGAAVIAACQTLNQRLEPFKKVADWADRVMAAFNARVNLTAYGWFNKTRVDFDFESNTGHHTDYYQFGVGCVETEVNMRTGDVTVLAADMFMDLGRSLNPAIDIGQIEGGFVQGEIIMQVYYIYVVACFVSRSKKSRRPIQ